MTIQSHTGRRPISNYANEGWSIRIHPIKNDSVSQVQHVLITEISEEDWSEKWDPSLKSQIYALGKGSRWLWYVG